MSTVELVDHTFVSSTRDTAALKNAIVFHLRYTAGANPDDASSRDVLHALGLAIRQSLVDRMLETEARYADQKAKRVYYLSMEFLIGQSLDNNLINLGMRNACQNALAELGYDLEQVIGIEPDAGLGNGGLGRLAACFIDSMATLGLAGYGYGINYEYGLFQQSIQRGAQNEKPDNWLRDGTPWQIARPDEAVVVPLFGRVENVPDRNGNYNPMWVDWQALVGVPHDMPVVGFGGRTVNFLRLFSARGSSDFDMDVFNEGDYVRAVEQKIRGETISKVLYPSDSMESGRELRLIQEYFLVACSVRDLVRRYEREHGDVRRLADHAAVQLNDTHPALTVVELMRFLVDEKDICWNEAWDITRSTLAYTNHTLLPEALEKWPVDLMAHVLPRHLEIIFEINTRFLREVSERWPGDTDKLRTMSLIDETPEKQVRMCNLAIVGSHSVNGVSQLHSTLVTTNLVPDFYALNPEKFNNKTNGVTPRRWLLQANPDLSELISTSIGQGWIADLDQLRGIESFASDPGFQETFLNVKAGNKRRLAETIQRTTNVSVDPNTMFDVQVKRIHEYKRQLLNVLRIIDDYLAIVEDGRTPVCPRTHVFAGKAAPGYWTAKEIIRLIHGVARVVNADPLARQWMKVVFLPNYSVSLAERIFPAADLSEQISTAGFEASGTGNMKFALNGAVTMGTLDGANVEIREEVGHENIFIFGLTADQIEQWHRDGGDRPRDFYNRNAGFRRIVDALRGKRFSPEEPGRFAWLFESLVEGHDPYFHLADLKDYSAAQQAAAELYLDRSAWAKSAILNVARVGKFSSDRTIREYADHIWNAQPAP